MRKATLHIVAGAIALLVFVGFAAAQEGAAAAQTIHDWGFYLGIALAVGLPAIATGFAQGKIGAAGAGAIAENRELFVPVMIMMALPETAVILGFVMSILILFSG